MVEKLEQVVDLMRLQGKLSSNPTTVEVYDEHSVVVYSDHVSGIGERHGIGEHASDNLGEISDCLANGEASRTLIEEGSKTIECNFVPVTDQSGVCGVIVTKFLLSDNESALKKAEEFMDCIDKINDSIDMMSIHFENLFDHLRDMQEKTGSISEGVENTSGVVSKIKANAGKSKILALNASIEAARSGEAGKGFTVVAKEMGEMATASGTSASEINDALQSIFADLEEITSSINDANSLAEKQTTSINEIQEYLGLALKAATDLGQSLKN